MSDRKIKGPARDDAVQTPSIDSPSSPPHRSGVVAILGRPNAGKSTLLNRLLGEKLAIVTAKPQTTRSRILGILTRETAQFLLLDTPGMHEGTKQLNIALNEQVDEAAADCDVALLLVDLSRGWHESHSERLAALLARRTPVVIAGTKSDLPRSRETTWPPPEVDAVRTNARHADVDVPVLRISALEDEGLKALLDAIEQRLPESPPLYPDGEISDRPLRFLAAELVREAAFEELDQELPYALAVEVIAFDEKRDDLIRISANLIVSRTSQKQIVIGRGGAVIKKIGIRARREIERLVGRKVHLELWVKVEPKWSKRPKRMKDLGYA